MEPYNEIVRFLTSWGCRQVTESVNRGVAAGEPMIAHGCHLWPVGTVGAAI